MYGRTNCFLTLVALVCSSVLILYTVLRMSEQISANGARLKTALYSRALEQTGRIVSKYVRNSSTTMHGVGANVHVKAANCSKLFSGEAAELRKADLIHATHKKKMLPDSWFIRMAHDCLFFKTRRQYIMRHVAEEELTFPIAFSILMYKSVEQVERLLRAIYRPQNYYCIHVDQKSSRVIYTAIRSIANCFRNVFVAKKRVDVVWGMYSVLEADLVCMQQLLKYKKWRYLINLSGMEFPLKTNGDLVKILKAYNGANDVRGITREFQDASVIARTQRKLLTTPTPYNISIVKGGVQVTLSRAFVQFMFTNKASMELREWLKETRHPDESYMSSLSYNRHLHAPGAYLGDPNTLVPRFLSRYIVWDHTGNNSLCHGKRRHDVCVFGVRDLASFPPRKELFLNKLMLDYQPLTFDCLEEWHFRQIRDEYMGRRQFNSTYYAETPFAKHHMMTRHKRFDEDGEYNHGGGKYYSDDRIR